MKDDNFHLHIYKPVEQQIREEEQRIRDVDIPPWPESKDSNIAKIQEGLKKRIDKCEARRQAWRESPLSQWPDIGELIEECVAKCKLSSYKGRIEFTKEADSWSLRLDDVGILPGLKQRELSTALMDELQEFLSWPEERNG